MDDSLYNEASIDERNDREQRERIFGKRSSPNKENGKNSILLTSFMIA